MSKNLKDVFIVSDEDIYQIDECTKAVNKCAGHFDIYSLSGDDWLKIGRVKIKKMPESRSDEVDQIRQEVQSGILK